jgi:hypothetical protein
MSSASRVAPKKCWGKHEDGSDWRLATGDWSNGNNVGVAISHDGKTAANGDWRLATGDWSNGNDVGVAISHDGKTAANGDWRLVKRQRCWSGYQPRREDGSDGRLATGDWSNGSE